MCCRTIEVVSGKPRVRGNVLVRVGASNTNEQLRRWCVTNNKYTYSVNAVIVEITMGGSNATICHGHGRGHPTLSDLVRKAEYVDCNGNVQVVSEPRHLRAAAGCFGLMGVITHLTLEFELMTYSDARPARIHPPTPLPLFKTHLPNALHFQRGIQTVRVVLNVEVDIAFPPIPTPNSDPSQPESGSPDWEIVQRVW